MLTIVQNAKLLPNSHQTFCEAFPGVPKLSKLSGVSNQNLFGLVFPTVYRLEGQALTRVTLLGPHLLTHQSYSGSPFLAGRTLP